MKRIEREIFNCLLCDAPIKEVVTWTRLLINSFAKSICEDCEKKFERYNHVDVEVYSLYHYNPPMRDYIQRYKFLHDVILAKVFQKEIHQYLSKRREIIVPIPIHLEKKKERTFAHVDELLFQAKIPFTHYLEKITTETQLGKTREERINSSQLFQLKAGRSVRGKEFIVVDDIYTTGTTIQHAKKILYDFGAKNVDAFTLIRG